MGRCPGPLARVLAAVAGPVVSAQTWLAVIHLMAGVVTGALAFGVIVALAVAGIGTLWLFLIGLPVLVAALWLSLQFGRAERARFLVMLGVRVPAAPVPVSPGPGPVAADVAGADRARGVAPRRVRADPAPAQPRRR